MEEYEAQLPNPSRRYVEPSAIEQGCQKRHEPFVNLLPEMSAKDLNKRNFKSRDFSVHKNARQIELNLEADVDIRSINCRTPPKGESSIWNLIEARALCVGELLVTHRL